IIELNGKKVAELRQIAKELEIKKADKLKKQELVYIILDEQAVNPQKAQKTDEGNAPAKSDAPAKKPRTRAKKTTAENSDASEKPKRTRAPRAPKAQNTDGDKKQDNKGDNKTDNNKDGAQKEQRSNRNPRNKQQDSDKKQERPERNDRGERGDRGDRGERSDRNERGERNDRRNQNNRNQNDRNNNRNNQNNRKGKPDEHGYNFDGLIIAEGVLEMMPDGYGFMRSSDFNYLNSPDDVYVSQSQVKLFGLQTGDTVVGAIRPPRSGEKYFPLIKVDSINGRSPEFVRDRVPFKYLTPLFPNERFNLAGKSGNISTRIMDLFSPIGKGQRGMIVAQPK
ncbi:MAG: Rho termination factor N-terminal domain-containing protein, partial [Bacteroidota bacterium]